MGRKNHSVIIQIYIEEGLIICIVHFARQLCYIGVHFANYHLRRPESVFVLPFSVGVFLGNTSSDSVLSKSGSRDVGCLSRDVSRRLLFIELEIPLFT